MTFTAASNRFDARDWLVLILVGGGFAAAWTWVFLHPSVSAYLACIGGNAATYGAFHFLTQRDDKVPDRNVA
jgi:uncharacterized BrkB/YihY/UPF0761 family membrane protein